MCVCVSVCTVLLFSRYVVSDSFVTPWIVAHQVPLSMGFSRQEYWRELPFPFPGYLLDCLTCEEILLRETDVFLGLYWLKS